MPVTCGIDIGSRTSKLALVRDGACLATALTDTRPGAAGVCQELLDAALARAGLHAESIAATVATGYGRAQVAFADKAITEITCHAGGARHLVPEARTVVDIGGQDSKVILLDEGGRVDDFVMNDKCAAGTGRFLEVCAGLLDTDLPGLDQMIARCDAPAEIGSTCVVFAETEIVGLLSQGAKPEHVAGGVADSIARRIASMAGSRVTAPVVFTGGVALLAGMAQVLARHLRQPAQVCPDPRMTGCLGAALAAASL